MQKITPFLWFDGQAEAAAEFYVSVFGDDAKITNMRRFPDNSPMPAGTLLSADFELAGQSFVALNGGPQYSFTPAVSFFISCDDQAEIDHFWAAFAEGGEEMPCGWVTDRFGLSWQVVPKSLDLLLGQTDPEKGARVMKAMLGMKRIVIAELEAAADATG